MSKMSQTAIDKYLSTPNIAHLVTLKEDGSPHVSPIWYKYQNGQLYIICNQLSVKAKNIENDSRVATSVATATEPYKYVLIEGTANCQPEDVEKTTLEISIHYQGGERGTQFANKILSSGRITVIRIIPHKIISWEEESYGST